MQLGGVTREFGVLATDSSVYDTGNGKMTFEAPKLFIVPKSGVVMSFIGTPLFLDGIPADTWSQPFQKIAEFLSKTFLAKREDVAQKMAEAIPDEDENKPHFCLMLMGMYGGYPTLAQLNSFADFKPKYLWTKDKPKFSTILYGDDSKPQKAQIFKEATEYVEMQATKHAELTPGLMAEVLTRGIYHKADQERKAFGKKYAGGVVNCALVTPTGTVSLSGAYPLGGLES